MKIVEDTKDDEQSLPVHQMKSFAKMVDRRKCPSRYEHKFLCAFKLVGMLWLYIVYLHAGIGNGNP